MSCIIFVKRGFANNRNFLMVNELKNVDMVHSEFFHLKANVRGS